MAVATRILVGINRYKVWFVPVFNKPFHVTAPVHTRGCRFHTGTVKQLSNKLSCEKAYISDLSQTSNRLIPTRKGACLWQPFLPIYGY